MINKAVVVLGTLVAVGAGWASSPCRGTRWTPPASGSVRGNFRSGGGAPATVADLGSSAPAADGSPPSDAGKPAVAKPDPSKPAVKTPPVEAPAAPQVAPKFRKISDVKLPVVQNSKELVLPKYREIHVDPENTMTWYGDKGQSLALEGFKHLGDDLRKNGGSAFVIVADVDVPWQQIRFMLQTGQNNYAANSFLGVARKEEADILRLLPLRQCERSDELMPEGDLFKILVESKSGAPVVSVDGKKIAAFPSDLAMAWNDWKAAHKDLADTSVPEKTRVLLEARNGASIGHVAQVIDVLRGIGIQTERLVGTLPSRPLK